MFSCCALFAHTDDPADVEHLKGLDVSAIACAAGGEMCRGSGLLGYLAHAVLSPPFPRGWGHFFSFLSTPNERGVCVPLSARCVNLVVVSEPSGTLSLALSCPEAVTADTGILFLE